MLAHVRYRCNECGWIWVEEMGKKKCPHCNSNQIISLGSFYTLYGILQEKEGKIMIIIPKH